MRTAAHVDEHQHYESDYKHEIPVHPRRPWLRVLARKGHGGAELPMNGVWAGSEVQVSRGQAATVVRVTILYIPYKIEIPMLLQIGQ